MQAQQLGGRRGVPVQLALHLTRAFVRSHRAQGRSVGILFLDLKEAFYRIVRGLVVRVNTEEALLQLLGQRLGLTDDQLQQLRDELGEATALQRTNVPEHTQRAISALHQDTHFHLPGQKDRCRTTVGTRPGDSSADVIFGYAWARLLKDVEQTLHDRGVLDVFPAENYWKPFQPEDVLAEGQVTFLGSTWMDDLCLCVSGQTCQEVESRLGFAAGVLLDRCHSFGMTPNLSRGKTEVLFSIQGPGSRAMRQKYFGGAASQMFPVMGQDGLYELHVTGEYCHLGNILHHSGKEGLEMTRRLSIAHQAFTVHRRQIYANPRLSMQRRKELFESLVLTKVLYGSETWTPQTVKHNLKFHAGIMRLYRRLGRVAHDAHVTDEEILARCGALSPTELLRRQRLRYLCVLYHCEQNVPWALLRADADWCFLVQCDFEWMYQQLWNASALPDPRESIEPWLTIIRLHPGYWKRLVRRAFKHAEQQRSSIEGVRAMHAEALQALAHHAPLSCEAPTKPTCFAAHYGCLTCGVRCKSLGGEGAHMFRRHKHVASHRKFCSGAQCDSCLREFHSYGRLANHMRHSQQCREDLLARGFRPPIQPSTGSTAHAAQERVHNGLRVCQTAAGPRLPTVQRAEEPNIHEEFFVFLIEELLAKNSEDFEQVVWQAPSQFALSWTRFCVTWNWFRRQLTQEDFELCQMTQTQFEQISCRVCDPAQWPIFQDQHGEDVSRQTLTLNDYEEWAYRLSCKAEGIWKTPAALHVPRQFTREKVLLHAFSGRRRHGDLQYYVDRVSAMNADSLVFVVSLDIIVDPIWGDVRAHGTRAFWLDGIRQGYVAGMVAGPPCNTWSVARGHQLVQDVRSRLPRIVRDCNGCLWGFLSLTLRELSDVQVGNDLLGFTLLAFIYLFLCGRSGVVEHPAMPEDETAASIWRLPIVQLILQLPGVDLRMIWQGLFGAETTKPTHLMLLNLPHFPGTMHPWMVTKEPPRGGSIGTDEQGRFKTARLKEYPPALNGGLAECFLTAFQREDAQSETHGCTTVPESFIQRCRQLVCTEYGDTIGQDYAGT